MACIVGVDVGGTFTDLIAVDERTGRARVTKVPTTLRNQAYGVLSAIEAADVPLGEIESIVHGTTTTTNAILERKISRTGLITTKGFRDVLELGRRTRPHSYGMTGTFSPLISRDLRLEVEERVDADGEILLPLDESEFQAAVNELLARGCESLVIHFLHSYANPAHERRAKEIAASLWPTPYITAGSEILPQFREFERGVTAAVNASIQPVLHRYLNRLQEELTKRNYRNHLLIMQGNGGMVSSTLVVDRAAHTVLSGPASGVKAAAYTASAAGFPSIVTYDMGGTSCDVALVRDGVPELTTEFEVEYAMPIHVPMVDIHTISAGGGSIARLDESGLLKVGPDSAGADPGPICYGRGGTKPTITDANLVLGRLNPDGLLGVATPVTVDIVSETIEREIGTPLGLTAVEAAAAIIRIANNKMAGALRLVSLSRGHDPRDFALFAFGGAGPMHAAALARELAIPKVLVPLRPGITSALGCVVADVRHDYVQTVNRPLASVNLQEARAILTQQIQDGRRTIEREQVPIVDIQFVHHADMQFQGQSHVLTVPLDGTQLTREALSSLFERAYWDRFRVTLPEGRIVLVSLRTAAIGQRKPFALESLLDRRALANTFDDARVGWRLVWFDGVHTKTPIYRRELLPLGARFGGPAVVEQLDTTVIVEADNDVEVDNIGNLVITVPN